MKRRKLTPSQVDLLERLGEGALFALQILATALAFGIFIEFVMQAPNV